MKILVGFGLLVCALAAQEQEAPVDIPSLMQAGNSAYMKGDYDAARQSFSKAWEMAQQLPPPDPLRYDILKRLTSVRAAAGNFADADNYLQMAINWRELTLGQNDPKIADDLLISVALCRGMKDYDRGRAILTRVMALHRINNGPESTAIAADFSRMAQLYMEEKKLEEAAGSFNTALEMRTKNVGALDPTLIPDLDRLGGVYINLRAYDKAEDTYRHALVIRETLLGKEDADLIATVDGLAYACFGQKKYEQAEPLYQRLISLWIKSLGHEEHPMVAAAYDKVATFYAEQKKYDQAKDAADRGIAIRAHFLASGLSNEATEMIAENNKDAAMALYRRAIMVLDPPNPLYDELKADVEGSLKAFEALTPKAPVKRAPAKKK